MSPGRPSATSSAAPLPATERLLPSALVRIGIDEISYRRHHKYLTLVGDHDTGHIVWGGDGRSGDTLGRFFDALGPDGCKSI
jgi:transposase